MRRIYTKTSLSSTIKQETKIVSLFKKGVLMAFIEQSLPTLLMGLAPLVVKSRKKHIKDASFRESNIETGSDSFVKRRQYCLPSDSPPLKSYSSNNKSNIISLTPKNLNLFSTTVQRNMNQLFYSKKNRGQESSFLLTESAGKTAKKTAPALAGNAPYLMKTFFSLLVFVLGVSASVLAQPDLRLKQMSSNAKPAVGSTVKFTLYLKNEGTMAATNIIVKDMFPSVGASPVTAVAQSGTAYALATGQWTVPTLAPNDSVKLELSGTVLAGDGGVFFNIAEVLSMNNPDSDPDSTPGNGVLGEDDYSTSCFSVPMLWMPGDEFEISIAAAGYTDVVWTHNGTPITGIPTDSATVTGSTLTVTGTGRFGFTAKANTCPASGCCELIVVPSLLGSLGDFVWKDTNDNGLQDSGEPGVNGVKVILWKCVAGSPSSKLDSTTTVNGNYKFNNLPTGTYAVQFVTSSFPLGCVLTPKKDAGDDTKDSDVNPAGVSPCILVDPSNPATRDITSVDAGLYSPLGTIGNYVWKDLNDNGIQDEPSSAGVDGVRMILWKKNTAGTFVKVDSMLTSGGGFYEFTGLTAGDYQVSAAKNTFPAGCTISLNPNGGDDTKDSDFDPTTIKSQVITLTPTGTGLAKDNPTIDLALGTFDLSIDKSVSGTTATFSPGAIVTFDIKVTNEGTMKATQVAITDQIPAGMTLADANWTSAAGVATLNTPIASILPGASATVQIKLQLSSTATEGSLTNVAQIKSAKDKNGNDVTDKDSTPGNGFDRNEDDDDDAVINVTKTPVFDLALTKALATGQDAIVKVGDLVKYTLTVKNEGTIAATQIVLRDSLPAEMTLADANWTAAGAIATLNTPIASLAVGAITTVDITVRVNSTFTFSGTTTTLTNYAEIKSAKDVNGAAVKDIDSTPNNATKGTEDDDDRVPITIEKIIGEFDLSLTKDLASGQLSIVKPGDNVTFKLTVRNEGSVGATQIVLRDSLPTGMTLNDTDWLASGQIATLKTPIASLAVGETTTVDITVKVNASFKGTRLVNYAEIKSAKDPAGNDVTDRDSKPNSATKGTEDDDDDEPVTVQQPDPVFDLSLAKALVGATTSFLPGDLVTFKLTVKNEGEIAATQIVLRDSLPAGLSLSDANWTMGANNIATLNTPIAGPIAVGASASVNITVKVGTATAPGNYKNNAEIKSAKGPNGEAVTDIDSKPNSSTTGNEDDRDDESITVGPIGCSIPPTPTCGGTASNECPSICVNLNDHILSSIRTAGGKFEWHSGSTPTAANLVTDPTCVKTGGKYFLFEKAACGEYSNGALLEVVIKECPSADLSLTKTVDNKTPLTGGNVTYTVKVKNDGPAAATNVEATDVLPAGLTYVSGGTGVTQAAGTITFKAASIAVGSTATFTFVAKVTATTGTIKNYAQVSKSDQPDVDSTPGNGTDKGEDDDDSVDITVGAPCSIPPTPTCGGTASNECPTLCINLNDNILSTIRTVGGVFEWHTASTPTATSKVADPTKVCTSGKYFLFEKAACGEYSNGALLEVVIKDCPSADLSLAKTVDIATPAANANVTYTIKVKNDGPSVATNVEATDVLPAGLTYVSGGTGVTQAAGTITFNAASIAVGSTATFTFVAKVTATTGSIKNYAQISKSDQPDKDSTPNNGVDKNEDDDDNVTITVTDCTIPPTPTCGGGESVPCPPNGCVNLNTFIKSVVRTPGGVFEWHTSNNPTAANFASTKITDPTCVKTSGNYYVFEKATCGEYSNGALLMLTIQPCEKIVDVSITRTVSNTTPALNEVLTYSITVRNDGPEVATNVTIKDLLPAGLEFLSSSDFTLSGNTLNSRTIASLAVGGSVTLTFTARPTVSGTFTNTAQVSNHTEKDKDSTPNNGYSNGEDDVADITIRVLCGTVEPPVLTCANTNLCPGETTTITAIGCLGGVVTWNTGATGQSIVASPTATTTYTATCKKGDCASVASNPIVVNVGTPTQPTVVASPSNTVCINTPVTLTATGCAGTLVWNTGANASQIVVVPSATTTYTVTCQIGKCVSTPTTTTITVTPTPATPTIVGTNTVCPGQSVTLTAANCAGSVEWSTGAVGATISVNPAVTTSYWASCNVNGCRSGQSAPFTVTVQTLSAPTVVASNTSICLGNNTTLTASNCTGSVVWSNGQTGASIVVSPTSTTNYTAKCISGVCMSGDSAPVTVTVGNATTPIITPSKTLLCAGETAVMTATGCEGGIVNWSNGGVGASITVAPSSTTTYTATCRTSTCTSGSSNAVTITVKTNGIAPTVVASKSAICAGESVTLTASGCSTGVISWSTGATGASIVVTPGITTTYTASCVDANVCNSTPGTTTVTVGGSTGTPTITVSPSNAICSGTSVTLTATGCVGVPTWSTGATGATITVTPSSTTTYSVTCKAGTCESAPASTVITVTPAPSAPEVLCSATNLCPGESVTLYVNNCAGTVQWSTGVTGVAIAVSPMVTTSYTATCKVGNCTSPISNVYTITVTPIAAPVVTISKSNINLGESVTLTATGCDGTILWSNGMSGASIVVTPTASTSYTATCKKGSCMSVASVPVAVNVNICPTPATLTHSVAVCSGQSRTLTVAACDGGTVTWSNGGTGTSITVSPANTTTYTATCVKGQCTIYTDQISVVITNSSAPTILCSNPSICRGESSTITASGCAGTVLWSNGATGTSIVVTPTETASYTAKCRVDACESPSSAACVVNVGVPVSPVVSTSATRVCFGQSVTLTAAGTCAGFFTWSNGLVGNSITISPAATATYTAQCCTSNNCKSAPSNAVAVEVAPKVTSPITLNLANTCPFTTVDLARGVGNYSASSGLTMEFRTGNTTTSALVTNPSAVGTTGTYYVFYRNAGGCYSEGVAINVMITNCNTPTPPCSTNPATANAGADATICAALMYKLTGSIGGAATTARWTTSGTGTFSDANNLGAVYYPSLADLIGGRVTLTLTTNDPDGSGTCSAATDNMVLTLQGIKFRPTVMINGTAKADTLPLTMNICGNDSVVLRASETGYKFKWLRNGTIIVPVSTQNQLVVKESGTYTYQLVDENSCCSISSATLIINKATIPMPLAGNVRNACPTATVNLNNAVTGIVPAIYTLEFRAGNNPSSDLVVNPASVTAGTYFAYYKQVGTTCYSAAAPIEAKIFDCTTDTPLDLSIKISVNTPTAKVGDNLTYQIVVKNNSTTKTATNVDIRNMLPNGLELVNSNMTFSNGVLLAKIPSIVAGDSSVFTIVAKTLKATTLNSEVSIVYADQTDSNTANNVSQVTTVVTGDATTPTIPPTTGGPSIGTSLSVVSTTQKPDGSYDVVYQIIVKNTGTTALTNVQVADSLTKGIDAPSTFTVVGTPTTEAGSTLVTNPNYNGTTDKNILGAGSTLPVGAADTIRITINIKPNGDNGPYAGNVIASGSTGSSNVSDKSNSGSVVDQPSGTSTPVRFDLPANMIGLAKSVGTPVAIDGGSFRIPYTIKVTNSGNSDLMKVQVYDDLAKTFGSSASIIGKPTLLADAGFKLDTNYTGQGLLTKLLVDSLSTLPKGTTREIRLSVTVRPTSGAANSYSNIAIGTAYTAANVMVADTSASGSNADPDNDLDPRNNNSGTPITLNSTSPGKALLGAALSIKDTIRKGDGSMDITYRILLKNYSNTILTGVQAKDSLSRIFNALAGASYKVIGTPIANDSSGLRINPDFDGDKDANLLIAQQSKLAANRLDSLFFTINVKTDGRLTPYLNAVCARAIVGTDSTLLDWSMNGLNPDPNGNNDPTETTEAERTPIVITGDTGELFIPEGFSPNGDGINDLFVIRKPAGTVLKVEIYNRWMHLVYRSDDYQNDWNGVANGGVSNASNGIPAGTYYYNVMLHNETGEEIKRVCRFMTINR